jgi:hypothetical protein
MKFPMSLRDEKSKFERLKVMNERRNSTDTMIAPMDDNARATPRRVLREYKVITENEVKKQTLKDSEFRLTQDIIESKSTMRQLLN